MISQEYEWGTIVYNDASHRYWLHDANGNRTPLPSVTTALNVLAKPELLRWYEQMGIEGVREALQRNLINPGDRDLDWTKTVRENQLGAEAKRDAGAARGTLVHEALRLYHADGTIPQLAAYRGPEENYIAGLQTWLVQTEPDPIHVEKIVGSPRHLYAGRPDLIADFDDRRLLIDLKTRKDTKAYAIDMMQLDGYWTACHESGIHDITGAAILAIGADGVYKLTEMPPEARYSFVKVLEARQAFEGVKKALRG